jgi:hypothetical protein
MFRTLAIAVFTACLSLTAFSAVTPASADTIIVKRGYNGPRVVVRRAPSVVFVRPAPRVVLVPQRRLVVVDRPISCRELRREARITGSERLWRRYARLCGGRVSY